MKYNQLLIIYIFINNNLSILGMKGSQIGAIVGGIVVVIVILIFMVSSEPQNEVAPVEDKFLVYTTFYPLQQFTINIATDAAEVRTLIPTNGDPHAFELTPKTIVALTKADMLVYNGADFEPYIDEIKSSSDFSHIVFVDSSEGITLLEGEKHDHGVHDEHAEEFLDEISEVIEEFEHDHFTISQTIESIKQLLHEHEEDGHDHDKSIVEEIKTLLHEIKEGHIDGHEGIEEIHHLVSDEDVHEEKEDHELDHTYDPHIWLDPVLAKKQVMNIANHMATSDPENSEIYLDNANTYSERLDTLDQEIRTQLSSCKKDTFVPFHNAFSYFAERYNLHTLAVIQEFSPETPVTAKDIEELIHFAEENDIKYFFTEENRNSKLAERLASELGGDILLFSPLESLSEDDSIDTTYFDKMRTNVDNLKIALECS